MLHRCERGFPPAAARAGGEASRRGCRCNNRNIRQCLQCASGTGCAGWHGDYAAPLGQPGDVARAVLFFADLEDGFVTGQVVYVDSGYSVMGL